MTTASHPSSHTANHAATNDTLNPAMQNDRLAPSDTFAPRHLGPRDADIQSMLALLGLDSLDALTDQTIPTDIRIAKSLKLTGLADQPLGEAEALDRLHAIAETNHVARSCIGMGYYDCITPPVIQRNILENPGWYTQYTPYQAEISQGRLEALLNFQTLVADLTGLPLANASLLDEATAAAEAMTMCARITRKNRFFIADHCHPQTLAVVRTRASSLGIELTIGDIENDDSIDLAAKDLAGALVQYPTTQGRILSPDQLAKLADRLHDAGALFVVSTDLLALTLITPPGEFGADIAIGSAQRFGVPMGYGGPHAAFMATSEKHARKMPGRIVGVSKDARGKPAYRLAIQTREQHIKRDKATSNICTAQVLLAIMASMYAVYHGPQGLRRIAQRVHDCARALATGLANANIKVHHEHYFDTLAIDVANADATLAAALKENFNLRKIDDHTVGISFDETTTANDIARLLTVFTSESVKPDSIETLLDHAPDVLTDVERKSDYLTHPTFSAYHAEHELLRYIHRLQSRDISLAQSMIPLGSCTMKLNGTSQMIPVTWEKFARLHPYAPREQAKGYAELFKQLQTWLAEITGLPAVSLQPNAGSQGEYAGLLAIRAYHESRNEPDRNVCLIPISAHGTNPASAIIAGFEVAPVACDKDGNIDVADLQAKALAHKDRLGALMITYPSTHGVFEQAVQEICQTIHDHGGQVYMDGANLNAMVALCRPADIGADVCHINLHKTFCIPHGGGGPGMGPIAAREHLRPHLPGDPLQENSISVGPVSAAAHGSSSILPISWVYIALMGATGLKRATQVAILNANYMAKRLEHHYEVLFTGKNNRVAHEFVMDCRQFHVSAAIEVEDIAKRLMDYGFHAPTMSWPVPGTLMIEPTESESKQELDRLCDALISIREEIRAIEEGRSDIKDNPLKHAPHTADTVAANVWSRAYPRELGAYPAPWLREHKYWPPVARIDNPYGDRHLVCSCPPMSSMSTMSSMSPRES